MLVSFNLLPLRRIVNDVFDITGMAITVIDAERREVRGQGKAGYCTKLIERLGYANCKKCDSELLERCKKSGKMEYHICHAGLCDFAMPIIKEDVLVGYVLMGRVRLKNSLRVQKYQIPGAEDLDRLYYELPVLSKEQIEAIADLMGYIVFENAIVLERDDLVEEIVNYIDNNLTSPLGVDDLCKKFNVSKNMLYSSFRKKLGFAVNDYVTERRIAKAKKLFETTKMTVNEVSQAVGVPNQTYFCKLFKKRVGIAPKSYSTGYRKR